MAARPVIFTPAAEADLDDIYFTIGLDSESAADRLVEEIRSRTARLSLFPESGRARSEIADDVRSLTVRNYVVLYQVDEDAVTVVRVVHGARDLNALF